MTKIIYVVFILLSTLASVTAQTSTSFAVLAGVNLQNLNGKDYLGEKLDNKLITGFHAGVNAQIRLASEFYFQPGLLFTTKGAKNEDGLFTTTYRLSYIELPLNLVFKTVLGPGYFMLGFGPYLAYGILGKVKNEGSGSTVESDIEFKNTIELSDPLSTSYFKPLDAGGNIFVGYELNGGIFINLNSQFGMLKLNPKDNRIPEGELSIKNTGFGLSMGYRF